MRHILFTSLIILANMVLAQETPPAPAPFDPVAGHWQIASRSCSSGAPIRDGFIVGRDSIMLSFFDGQYDGKTKVGPCTIWITGKYETKDNMLRVFNLTGASNCNPQPTFTPSTSFFTVMDNQLKIYTSSNQYNTSCPPGDMLESVYTQVGK